MDSFKFYTIVFLFYSVLTVIQGTQLDESTAYDRIYNNQLDYQAAAAFGGGSDAQTDFGKETTDIDSTAGNPLSMSFNWWNGLTRVFVPWSIGIPKTPMENVMNILVYIFHGIVVAYTSFLIFLVIKNRKND